MRWRLRGLVEAGVVLLSVVSAAIPASPQTNETYSFGPNLGTLNYAVTSTARTCNSEYGQINYTLILYNSFVYVSSQNVKQPISGETEYFLGIGGRLVGSGNCPKARWGPTINYSGSGYTISISPQDKNGNDDFNATIIVPGFINPKYLIVGVMYAPPGSNSSVTYSNNSVVGNSTMVSSSFSSQVMSSFTVSAGGSIPGFSASITSTVSNSYTQEQDSSLSVAVSQTTSSSTGLKGFSDPNKGVNHDYDYIFVWLNPITRFTLTNNNGVQWNGYGYDLNDTPAYPDMDVVGIQLGCLNGDFYTLYKANPSANPQWLTCEDVFNNNFNRSWALANEDGTGPALTPTLANATAPYDFCTQASTDLYKVCQADPFSNPSYVVMFASGSNTTTDGRFTACSNSSCNATIDYEPNLSKGYSQGYSTTVMQSETSKYTYQTGYSLEVQFKGGDIFTISDDLKTSTMFTWTNQFMQATNNSNGETASFSIVGPAEGYTGPTIFVVYQDNLYGTFMFYPGD